MVTAEELAFGAGGTRQELTQDVRDELNLRVPVGDVPYDLTLTAAEVRPEGMALGAACRGERRRPALSARLDCSVGRGAMLACQ